MKNEETGDFEEDGDPFEVEGTSFRDEQVVEGKEYQYMIKAKSIPLR